MASKKQLYKPGTLEKIVNEENSCVSLVQSERKLALLPIYQNDLKSGVSDFLYKSLKKFDRNLNGILMGYKNVKILLDNSNTGRITGRCGEFEVNVKLEYYIFQPKIGSYLEGVVNKKSNTHIGCLVHRYFNATILKPDHIEYEDWSCRNIDVRDKIVFKVVDLDFSGILPYIEGFVESDFIVTKGNLENGRIIKSISGESTSGLDDLDMEVVENVENNNIRKLNENRVDLICNSTQRPSIIENDLREEDFNFLSPVAPSSLDKKKNVEERENDVEDDDLMVTSTQVPLGGKGDLVEFNSLSPIESVDGLLKQKRKKKKKDKEKERNEESVIKSLEFSSLAEERTKEPREEDEGRKKKHKKKTKDGELGKEIEMKSSLELESKKEEEKDKLRAIEEREKEDERKRKKKKEEQEKKKEEELKLKLKNEIRAKEKEEEEKLRLKKEMKEKKKKEKEEKKRLEKESKERKRIEEELELKLKLENEIKEREKKEEERLRFEKEIREKTKKEKQEKKLEKEMKKKKKEELKLKLENERREKEKEEILKKLQLENERKEKESKEILKKLQLENERKKKEKEGIVKKLQLGNEIREKKRNEEERLKVEKEAKKKDKKEKSKSKLKLEKKIRDQEESRLRLEKEMEERKKQEEQLQIENVIRELKEKEEERLRVEKDPKGKKRKEDKLKSKLKNGIVEKKTKKEKKSRKEILDKSNDIRDQEESRLRLEKEMEERKKQEEQLQIENVIREMKEKEEKRLRVEKDPKDKKRKEDKLKPKLKNGIVEKKTKKEKKSAKEIQDKCNDVRDQEDRKKESDKTKKEKRTLGKSSKKRKRESENEEIDPIEKLMEQEIKKYKRKATPEPSDDEIIPPAQLPPNDKSQTFQEKFALSGLGAKSLEKTPEKSKRKDAFKNKLEMFNNRNSPLKSKREASTSGTETPPPSKKLKMDDSFQNKSLDHKLKSPDSDAGSPVKINSTNQMIYDLMKETKSNLKEKRKRSKSCSTETKRKSEKRKSKKLEHSERMSSTDSGFNSLTSKSSATDQPFSIDQLLSLAKAQIEFKSSNTKKKNSSII